VNRGLKGCLRSQFLSTIKHCRRNQRLVKDRKVLIERVAGSSFENSIMRTYRTFFVSFAHFIIIVPLVKIMKIWAKVGLNDEAESTKIFWG